MDSRELREMLRSIHCEQEVSVLPADALELYSREKMPPVGFSCILNTEPSTDSGEHWIGIKVLSKNKLIIFDSLSSDQHLQNKYVKPFRKLFHGRDSLERNVGLLQDPFSTSCGMFCIYFFHHYCNEKMSLPEIIESKFSEDIIENECLVLSFISSRYDKNLYSNVISTCRR
jgi:hypothetical protein